jgi:hypothetical protein
MHRQCCSTSNAEPCSFLSPGVCCHCASDSATSFQADKAGALPGYSIHTVSLLPASPVETHQHCSCCRLITSTKAPLAPTNWLSPTSDLSPTSGRFALIHISIHHSQDQNFDGSITSSTQEAHWTSNDRAGAFNRRNLPDAASTHPHTYIH